MTFNNPADYELCEKGKQIVFPDIRQRLEKGDSEIPVRVDGREIVTLLNVSARQRKHLVAGGTLNFVKESLQK